MIEQDWLKRIRERPQVECPYCEKKLEKLGSHIRYCKRNPNQKKPEECPHCHKPYIQLPHHIIFCKKKPNRNKDQKKSKEKIRTKTVYLPRDFIEMIRGDFESYSETIRRAISQKIERERQYDLKANKTEVFTFSLSIEKINEINNVLKMERYCSASEFIRIAVLEAVKNKIDEKNDLCK